MLDEDYGCPDNWTEEDLIEELLRRNGHFSDEQVRIEVSRAVTEHGTAEKALDHIEQRVETGVTLLLGRIEQEARVYGVLVAARDELLEQTDDTAAAVEGDSDDST